MPSHTRFRCPSASLALKTLLKRTQRTLFIGMALAMGVHAALTRLRVLTEEQKTVKPLTTQFIKRQPRLSKPLELKKRPQPKRRLAKRKMVAVTAKMQRDSEAVGFQARQLLNGLATPPADIRRLTGFERQKLEPTAVASAVEGARQVEQKIDMSLELLDIEALDTGKHHALVIQDSQDRRSVRGFCHLAALFSRALYPRSIGDLNSFDRYILPGFLKLVEAMNQFTDIKTDMLGRLALHDSRIFKAPWLLFGTYDRLERPSVSELENLGRYLVSGGFVFADSYNYFNWGVSAGYASLRDILLSALATEGIEVPLEIIPNDHPVYHCYFDFDGPPIGQDAPDKALHPDEVHIIPYLEGVETDGRLLFLLSGKLIYRGWYFGTARSGYPRDRDPRRPLQFGVNTVVFALTQEGSITHRLMESVAY